MKDICKFKGFGGIKSPHDLLVKLRHDFKRMSANSMDAYAAFDFFVSAHHMLDWLNPNNNTARKAEEVGSILMLVCSHLANGAKHFSASNPQHNSVNDITAQDRTFFGGTFFGEAFFGTLTIQLDGDAAEVFGDEISAIDFASKVLDFWEADPRLQVPCSTKQ